MIALLIAVWLKFPSFLLILRERNGPEKNRRFCFSHTCSREIYTPLILTENFLKIDQEFVVSGKFKQFVIIFQYFERLFKFRQTKIFRERFHFNSKTPPSPYVIEGRVEYVFYPPSFVRPIFRKKARRRRKNFEVPFFKKCTFLGNFNGF